VPFNRAPPSGRGPPPQQRPPFPPPRCSTFPSSTSSV